MPNEPMPEADVPRCWQAWCECCDDPASERRLFEVFLKNQNAIRAEPVEGSVINEIF